MQKAHYSCSIFFCGVFVFFTQCNTNVGFWGKKFGCQNQPRSFTYLIAGFNFGVLSKKFFFAVNYS